MIEDFQEYLSKYFPEEYEEAVSRRNLSNEEECSNVEECNNEEDCRNDEECNNEEDCKNDEECDNDEYFTNKDESLKEVGISYESENEISQIHTDENVAVELEDMTSIQEDSLILCISNITENIVLNNCFM